MSVAPPAVQRRTLSRKFSLAAQRAADAAGDFAADAAQLLDIGGTLGARLDEADARISEGARATSATAAAAAAPFAAAAGSAGGAAAGRADGGAPDGLAAGAAAAAAATLAPRRDPAARVVLLDKIAFFLGVWNVALSAYWVGAAPHTFHHYWLAKCLLLFTFRFFSYRRKGHHWLMLEFCYLGNLAGLYFAFLAPASAAARRVAFGVSAGPLMFSILAMRNSLVLHSADHMTTLMMHASPAVFAWVLRWRPDPAWTAGMGAAERAEYDTATWAQLTLASLGFYFAWLAAYALIFFLLLPRRIEARGRMTMMKLMVPADAAKAARSPLARLVNAAPPRARPLAYLACHALAATVAFLPVKLFWASQIAHTTALLGCLSVAAWNGGGYYFHVFAKKYAASLAAAGKGE
jgi:hypothetical protein